MINLNDLQFNSSLEGRGIETKVKVFVNGLFVWGRLEGVRIEFNVYQVLRAAGSGRALRALSRTAFSCLEVALSCLVLIAACFPLFSVMGMPSSQAFLITAAAPVFASPLSRPTSMQSSLCCTTGHWHLSRGVEVGEMKIKALPASAF